MSISALFITLLAQTPEARPTSPPTPPILRILDVDQDGILSAAEIAQAPARLKLLDTNGDGRLTPDEYRPPRPGGKGQGIPPATDPSGKAVKLERPRPPLDCILDENGDEVIDAQEIARASLRLKLLDTNGDGRLTPDESAPRPNPAAEGRTRTRD